VKFKAVFFDAGETLVHPHPSFPELFSEILAREGYDLAPQVVADRICQAVDAVGDRERVIASTDCGFGTFAGSEMVAETVVWAKLQTLARGAELASARLWG
jgi:5-methyltetrahydropteroyltriglutamate--homocysteine methyltransferase